MNIEHMYGLNDFSMSLLHFDTIDSFLYAPFFKFPVQGSATTVFESQTLHFFNDRVFYPPFLQASCSFSNRIAIVIFS